MKLKKTKNVLLSVIFHPFLPSQNEKKKRPREKYRKIILYKSPRSILLF